MKLFLQILFKDIYHNLSSREAREFLRLVLLYGDKKRFSQIGLTAGDYRLYIPDTLSFLWQFKEIIVDEYYKFNSRTAAPVIYDCGSNIGMSCLYFKKLYPEAKVKAFEADSRISKILKKNLIKNNAEDVEVINKAVWVDEAGIEISIEGADAATIFSEGKKVKVDSVRLKSLIELEEKIDLLKMDIEGAEFEVIKDCGNSLSCVEHIFIECHTFKNKKQEVGELLKILEENNFRYFIKPEQDRANPFINRTNKNFPEVDLQINIFGYRE